MRHSEQFADASEPIYKALALCLRLRRLLIFIFSFNGGPSCLDCKFAQLLPCQDYY